MSYTIEINHEHKIILYKHTGTITKEQIGDAWKEFLLMEEFTLKKYNLLSDYTEAKFNMKLSESTEITNFLYTIKKILIGKKQALVVNNPFNTSVSMLFENEVYEKVGFIVHTFSTQEAAIHWLKK